MRRGGAVCACELCGTVRVQVAEAEVYKLHISTTCRAQQTARISGKTKSSTSTRTVVQCCVQVVSMSPAEQQQQQQQQLCDVREVKNAVEKIEKNPPWQQYEYNNSHKNSRVVCFYRRCHFFPHLRQRQE